MTALLDRLGARAGAVAAVVGVGLCTGGLGGRPQPPPVVTVAIHHSRFVPDRLVLPAGRLVRIVVRNEDPIDHELVLGDLAVQARHEHGTDRVHHESGAVSVPADSTAATTWTLPRGQPAFFGCHLPGHWAYGMQGLVVPA